jgi:hypothetical protein
MSQKLYVFAARDAKAEIYGTPMFFPTVGLATRAFSEQANNPESMICKHAEDFCLFRIGEYDQDTGLLTPLPAPEINGPRYRL